MANVRIRKDGFWWKSESANCYKDFSSEKYESLGSTMTIKALLDLWWNRVDIEVKPGLCWFAYKCEDKTYDGIDNIAEELEIPEKEVLKLDVIVNDTAEYDDDDNPIVGAVLVGIK